MTTFNSHSTAELIAGLEEYLENLEKDDELTLECLEDEEESQRYTLGFYNWMIGGNAAVVKYYRQFDNVLLTREQAVEALEDAMYDLCDIVEDESGDVVGTFTLDCVNGTAEVPLYIDGDTYTAHIWVEAIEDVKPHTVDVCGNDSYWAVAAA